MKHCDHCGAENPQEAKFCRGCGSKFAEESVAAPVEVAQPVAETAETTEMAEATQPAVPAVEPQPATEPMPVTESQTAVEPQPAPVAEMPTQPIDVAAQPQDEASATQAMPVQPAMTQPMQPTQPIQPVYQQPMQSAQPTQPFPAQPQPAYQQPTQPIYQQAAQPAYQQPYQPQPGQPAQPQPQPDQARQAAQAAAQAAQQAGQAAAQVAQAVSGSALFGWLWESFRHPSHKAQAQSWWPVIPLVFNSFLLALTSYLWQTKAVSAAVGLGNDLLGYMSGYSGNYISSRSVPISEFFKSWVLFAAMFYLVVLLCFMGLKLFGDHETTFAMMHAELGQKFMPMVALNLVAFLCALIGSGLLAISALLVVVGMLYLMATPGAIIAQATNYRKLDKTWMWILTMLLCGFIFFVFFVILSTVGVMSAMSSLM